MEQESAGGGFSRRSRGIGNQYLRKPIARERLEGYMNQQILSAALREPGDILNSSEGNGILSIAPSTRRLHSKYQRRGLFWVPTDPSFMTTPKA